MFDMLPTQILSAAVLAATLLAFKLLRLKVKENLSLAFAHTSLISIRGCLDPPDTTLGQLLDERARANTRLVNAFELSNTFVSPSPSIHRSFVAQARGLLKQANKDGWATFRDLTTQAIEAELSELDETDSIPYDIFIQCLSLRVILVGLLGVDASVDSFARDDLLIATNHINELWALSKKPESIPPHLLPELQNTLRRLVPDAERYPNPVDFVIPAWETLWRVVAIAVAHSHQDDALSQVLFDFYSHPDVRTFGGAGSSLSARNIVEETMRMYPPSKHIGRMRLRPFARRLPHVVVKCLDTAWPAAVRGKESADIIALQRSEDIWGLDADMFNPWRHVVPGHHCQTDREKFATKRRGEAMRFVFGGGPLQCIGASWAPVAVAVLGGAVIAATNEDGEGRLVQGSGIGGRDGWDGWCIVKRSK